MLDYRSWGDTKNCHGCRYWSEMLAQAIGDGPLEAMCLAQDGPYTGKYTTKRQTCKAYEEGSLGAVDDPGGNPYAALSSEGDQGDQPNGE